MTLDYRKVWKTMNDLEQTILKLNQTKDIIDAASDAIQNTSERMKAESLCYAASDYLELLLNQLDEKFQAAWKATVKELNHSSSNHIWHTKAETDGVTGMFIELPPEFLEIMKIDENDELEIHYDSQTQQTTIRKI